MEDLKLDVWQTPDKTWTVRLETRDKQGRRVVNFLGEWSSKEVAQIAQAAALRGEPLPESIKR